MQFGIFDINALVQAVTYWGVAFPLLFRLLPKKGNSNTKERIEWLFAILTIAFLWVYRVGIIIDQLKPIRILNNGHKVLSFFKNMDSIPYLRHY